MYGHGRPILFLLEPVRQRELKRFRRAGEVGADEAHLIERPVQRLQKVRGLRQGIGERVLMYSQSRCFADQKDERGFITLVFAPEQQYARLLSVDMQVLDSLRIGFSGPHDGEAVQHKPGILCSRLQRFEDFIKLVRRAGIDGIRQRRKKNTQVIHVIRAWLRSVVVLK